MKLRFAAERRRRLRSLGAATILGLACLAGGAAPAAAAEAVEVRINNRPAGTGIVDAERVLVPAREVLARLGAEVRYDAGAAAVVIERGSTVLLLRAGQVQAVRAGATIELEAAPTVVDGKFFVPARSVIEALGDDVEWDPEARVLRVQSLYAEQLAQAGRLPAPDEAGAAAGSGATPEPRPRIPFSEDDVELLARVVSLEAWGEPFEGMVAVAAVVINRVLSPQFPDTIRDVVSQPGQFPPIRDASGVRVHPRAREAVLKALYGWDPSQGALYFYNPRLAGKTRLRERPVTVRIGNHVFVR